MIREPLEQANYNFSRKMLQSSLLNFQKTGQSILVLYDSVESDQVNNAIETKETDANAIAGAAAIVSSNPVIPLCAYANNDVEHGLKFYFPNDSIIQHGTNIHGFLDVIADIYNRATTDEKFSLLLRLYRASLRETEIDNQILFQLILLEEASDNSVGKSFAERLRNFCTEQQIIGDFDAIASELNVVLPGGKDLIDVLIKLRNAASHNGKIDEDSLRQYNADWVIPLIRDKELLYKLVRDVIRFTFCCIVGHHREKRATKVEPNSDGLFIVCFD